MGGQSSLTLAFVYAALAHSIAPQVFAQPLVRSANSPMDQAGRTVDAAERQLDAAANRLDNAFVASLAPVYVPPATYAPIPTLVPTPGRGQMTIHVAVPTTSPPTPITTPQSPVAIQVVVPTTPPPVPVITPPQTPMAIHVVVPTTPPPTPQTIHVVIPVCIRPETELVASLRGVIERSS